MADIAAPPYVSFAGGMFSGRVDSERRESAEATWYQLVAVDAGPLGTGATVASSMISQATGYQLQASFTLFTTVTPAVSGNGNTPTAAIVLPQTSRPYPFIGLQVSVANYGANPINCYPHPSDSGNSINGQAPNVPVVLGPNTVTPFQCMSPPGIWNAVDIGGGFAGSIETVVSQGNVVSAGTNQGNATPITQGLVNFSSGSATPAGGTLPPAKAGMQVTIADNAGAGITIYGNGSDTINGTAGSTGLALTNATVTIFFCAVNGAWLTK